VTINEAREEGEGFGNVEEWSKWHNERMVRGKEKRRVFGVYWGAKPK
jgi:hypothetical protein